MKHLFLFFSLVIGFNGQSQEQISDSCIIQKKHNECYSMDGEQQYKKIREKADFYFYAGNYEKALNYYERMLLLRANDWYPKMQVQRMKVYIERGF